MGELQPIAFLLSASIVISGIFLKDNDLLNRIYILSAASCFFFAYIHLMSFRLTNFKLFFVPGIISLMAAFYFIFRAVIGVSAITTNLNEELYYNGHMTNLELIMVFIIISFIFVLTVYSLHKIKNLEPGINSLAK